MALTDFDKRMFLACLSFMSSDDQTFPWGVGIASPEQLKAIEHTLERLKLPHEKPHADKQLARAMHHLHTEGLIEPAEQDPEKGQILTWKVPTEVAHREVTKDGHHHVVVLNGRNLNIKAEFGKVKLPQGIMVR